MVAKRKQADESIWRERRPNLEDLRPKLTPEQTAAALKQAAGSWHGALDVERLLADIRWWRGHDD